MFIKKHKKNKWIELKCRERNEMKRRSRRDRESSRDHSLPNFLIILFL